MRLSSSSAGYHTCSQDDNIVFLCYFFHFGKKVNRLSVIVVRFRRLRIAGLQGFEAFAVWVVVRINDEGE